MCVVRSTLCNNSQINNALLLQVVAIEVSNQEQDEGHSSAQVPHVDFGIEGVSR